MSFPNKSSLRSDEKFLAKTDHDFHVGSTKSALTEIPGFRPVTNVVLDPMHLLYLGLMRKLLKCWLTCDNYMYRLALKTLSGTSYYVEHVIAKLTPKEFQRIPRSFQFMRLFKATELRQLLLYTGPVIFKDCLHEDLYIHFLELHVACRILSLCEASDIFLRYSERLLDHFVESFGKYFGESEISLNVHSLYHITEDVREHGSLEKFSAFIFENFMQSLKKKLRKSDRPLQQIYRRCKEKENFSCSINHQAESNDFKTHFEKQSITFCRVEVVCQDERNNCCQLKNGKIVIVEELITSKNGIKTLRVREFHEATDFYCLKDFRSSIVGVYKVAKLSHTFICIPVTDLQSKCYRMPYRDGFVVATLLHSSKVSE